MAQIAKDLSSTVTLNDGVVMPMFGFGTYQLSSGKGCDAEMVTRFALENGYRLVDTATFYAYVLFSLIKIMMITIIQKTC